MRTLFISFILFIAVTAKSQLYFPTSDSLLNLGFVIQPGDSNAEVRQEVIVQNDVQLVWMQPTFA